MFFDENGIKNYTKYLYSKVKNTKSIVHNVPNNIKAKKKRNFKKFNFLQRKY